jgi:hypothetical protein
MQEDVLEIIREAEVEYMEMTSGWQLHNGARRLAFLPKETWTREQVEQLCEICNGLWS